MHHVPLREGWLAMAAVPALDDLPPLALPLLLLLLLLLPQPATTAAMQTRITPAPASLVCMILLLPTVFPQTACAEYPAAPIHTPTLHQIFMNARPPRSRHAARARAPPVCTRALSRHRSPPAARS